MDLRVKQRLVGASILLALVVALVPELLSGPKPAVNLVMPDPASAPAATRTITVPVDSVADGPVPVEASPTPPSAAQSALAAPNANLTETAAPPLENSPSAPSSPMTAESSPPAAAAAQPVSGRAAAIPSDAWAVQLGSFASRPNAERLLREVSGKGYTPYISSIGSGAAVRYRVRVGAYAERAAAERTLAKLKTQGIPATLAPPSRP
jgi:DedD protein